MAAAFLPWEKWLGKLLSRFVHPLYVRLRRSWFRLRRKRALRRSLGWPEVHGEVYRVVWDSSLPREQILYSYSTEAGYLSGVAWRWFDDTNVQEVRVGGRVALRCNPANTEQSVLLRLVEEDEMESSVNSASSAVKRF